MGETIRKKYKEIYWAWKSIKQRTRNPNCKAYKNYGFRGISMCHEWDDFEPFLEWALSSGWKKGLDIDRKNNDGNYCPENCRWVSRRKNVNNRRCTLRITIDGNCKSISEWSDLCNIPRGSLKVWIETKGEEYVKNRILKAIRYGYDKKDYGNTHRKPVIHVETGKIYSSVRNAAKDFGIAPCTISNAMRNGKPTRKGRFKWEEV